MPNPCWGPDMMMSNILTRHDDVKHTDQKYKAYIHICDRILVTIKTLAVNVLSSMFSKYIIRQYIYLIRP